MGLTAADRLNKTEKALRMSARGVSYTEIGQQLGIRRQLASTLVNEGLANRAEHRDQDRERAIAHYQEVIRAAWQSYAKVDDRSLNKSGHLNAAIRAQERIDKIAGNEAPKKYEDTGPPRRFTLELGERAEEELHASGHEG